MADQQIVETSPTGAVQSPPQTPAQPPGRDEMLQCVSALESALLPCLPAPELQAIDRSPHPSHQSIFLPLLLFFNFLFFHMRFIDSLWNSQLCIL